MEPKADFRHLRTLPKLTNRSHWTRLPKLALATGPTTWLPGSSGIATGPLVIDTLTVPYDNPWKALMFTSGHDFFENGDAAVCTVHGDVWTVSGIDRDLRNLKWRRFATGLFQPLGLKIVRNQVYVLGRDAITILH